MTACCVSTANNPLGAAPSRGITVRRLSSLSPGSMLSLSCASLNPSHTPIAPFGRSPHRFVAAPGPTGLTDGGDHLRHVHFASSLWVATAPCLDALQSARRVHRVRPHIRHTSAQCLVGPQLPLTADRFTLAARAYRAPIEIECRGKPGPRRLPTAHLRIERPSP